MTRLSNRNLAGAAFGREASWNHSYEWNMRETAANRMTITFPNGIEIIFKPTGDPLLWEPTRPSQTATLYKWNNSWSLTFGEDADKVVFQQRFDTANATFYRVESITDDIGNVTSITYTDVNDKLIRQVTDASGRWIKLFYNDMGVATQVGDVLHTRLANSSHAGQWQVVNLTPGTAYRFLAYYQGNTYRQKNKLKIAEIEFYDENDVKITGGTPYGSTPLVNATTGPEKAFDGNITTFYQYNYLKGGYCGIDLGASPRKVSKIRYYIIAPINDDCDLTFVGQNVQSLPNWVVSHVEGSDGREIQYSYNVLTDPSGFFQWTRLTAATYPDATAAQYTYTQVHDYTMPSLLTANDPRYASALKNIRYQLGTNTVVGFVRQEINQATGIAVADVKWGADEHTPKLVYPNGRVTVAQFEENRLTKLTDSYGYKKTYTYTGTTGHLASATDELNRTTSFTRGYKGRLLSASYPGGRSITYTRDSFNRPLTINQNGRTTTHIYDVKGRRTRTTYPDTTFETWTYNTFGQPIVHRQRNGFTESYTYDASGLRRTHTDAAGAVTTWHYYGDSSYPATNDFNIAVNVVGRLAAVVDAHGNATSYSYNDRSQITSETTTPGGNITRAGVVVQDSSLDFTTTTLNTYDDYGNLIARIVNNSDPASAPRLWQYQYDSLGRRIREEDPLNRVTYYAYDINGVGCDCGTSDKPLQITHPDGSITRHVYDKEWRLLSTTHAFGMTGLAATTSYTYDAAGQRRSMKDPLDHITRWNYDAAGNVTSEIRAFGTAIASTTSHTYDVHGNRLTSTSPVGTISTTTYDNMDRPVNMTDATGTTDAATTTYNYEPATGRMISVIDPLTRTTGFVHDPLDRVIRTNLPDANYTESFYDLLGRNYRNRDLLGNFPRRVYDSQGQTIASINAAGITTTAFYDGHGNLTQTSLPSGKSVSYTHDILGNVIKTTVALGTAEEATVSEILTRDLILRPLTTRDGAGSVTTTTYDLLGRTLTVKNAINTLPTFTYTYDLDGQLLTTKAADNLITSTRTYDALHRLKTEKDGKNQTIEYFYDAASRMTSYKDAKLATFSFEYYPTGRLKKRIEPDTTFQTYTYDVLGRLVLHTKADGKIKTHFYENPNRDFLTKITYTLSGSGAVSEPPRIYTHAADGQILTATNAHAAIARGYDSAGRITSETQSFTSGPSGTFSYDYDTVDGNLDNHTRPDGNVVDYTYNQRNLLEQVNSSSSTVAAYTYNARNQILTTSIGGGLFTATRGYDAAARLTGISNGTLDSTGYTLSADGRRTGISRNGSAESYGYDNARQVTTANYTGLSTAQSWTYDANGNRITAVNNSVTTNYTANSVNEYLTISGGGFQAPSPTYDDNGNALILPRPNSTALTFTWDINNQQSTALNASGDSAAYQYDALGRRTKRTETIASVTTETYFFTNGWNVELEHDGTQYTKRMTWGLDLSGTLQGAGGVGGLVSVTQLPVTSGSATTYYPTYDGNGNITAWVDSAGTVVATQRYDAFGNIIQQTGTAPSNYGFSTKPQEKVTGLIYYGLRYYEPITGRWPNRDPIWEDGGMNMYGFVSNDGVGKWDYLGNIIISDEGEEYRKKVKESLEKITGAKLKWEPHTTKTECKDIDENKLWILVEENTGKGEGKLYNDLMEGINAPEKNNGAADKGVQALIIIIKQEKDGVANLTGACCDVASRIRRLHLHDKADADMTSSSDETIKSGFDGLLWHELVGHGIKGLKHPTGRDNVEEVRRKNIEKGKEVPLNPDPVIQIENEARSKLGTPLRYPTYDKTLEDQRSR